MDARLAEIRERYKDRDAMARMIRPEAWLEVYAEDVGYLLELLENRRNVLDQAAKMIEDMKIGVNVPQQLYGMDVVVEPLGDPEDDDLPDTPIIVDQCP